MQRQTRSGFTLVELLVVITIIGILISLTFPTLSGMRETSRRTTCGRNLARIGVALQSYEDAHCFYPSGTINPEGPIHNRADGKQMGWLVQILPYLDEKVTYDHVDLEASVYDAKNLAVRELDIAAFVCPSETNPRPTVGVLSYAASHHSKEAPIDASNNGVFFLNSKVATKDVSDGLSHTIFVGEKRIGLEDLGWMSGTRATLRNAGTPINVTPVHSQSDEPRPASEEQDDLFVGGFGSAHPVGCHFLFGDGAVRFMDTATELDVLQQLCDRADGALITKGPLRAGL